MRLAAKKSLGQHFLLNPTLIDKILSLAKIAAPDRILEIGPGPGLMTRRLAERAAQVIAVEKDARFSELLQTELKEYQNLKILSADFLSLNLETILEGRQWKVVANLPYNIATEVIFHLLEKSTLFSAFYLMVQWEVANRLTAQPGTKDYGHLSIFSQLLSENRIVMKLPPGAFTPPPKVYSALVEFKIHEVPRFDIQHLPTFEAVVQAAFGQRRKMIRNCLKASLKTPLELLDQGLAAAGIRPEQRAETVSIPQFTQLANFLALR